MMRDLKNRKKSAEKTDNVRWNEMWEVPRLSANEIKIVDEGNLYYEMEYVKCRK